jgi:hypothetical protein
MAGNAPRHFPLPYAGLNPRIHQSSQNVFFEEDGWPGKAPAMTAFTSARHDGYVLPQNARLIVIRLSLNSV